MDGLVPELFNTIPVLNLATLEQKADIVRLLFRLGRLANEKVKLRVAKLILLADSTLLKVFKKKRFS